MDPITVSEWRRASDRRSADAISGNIGSRNAHGAVMIVVSYR